MTDAAWSALVEREAGKWRVLAHYHLAKKIHPELVKFLGKTEVDLWLCGALSGGQSRSVSLPADQPSWKRTGCLRFRCPVFRGLCWQAPIN